MKMENELSKLKPFNLEAALKGEKVVTRDGRIADRFHKFDGLDSDSESVYAVVDGVVQAFWGSGSYNVSGESSWDLFMAPKERVVWVNLYGSHNGLNNHGWFYESEQAANDAARLKRLGGKAFPITIEEEE